MRLPYVTHGPSQRSERPCQTTRLSEVDTSLRKNVSSSVLQPTFTEYSLQSRPRETLRPTTVSHTRTRAPHTNFQPVESKFSPTDYDHQDTTPRSTNRRTYTNLHPAHTTRLLLMPIQPHLYSTVHTRLVTTFHPHYFSITHFFQEHPSYLYLYVVVPNPMQIYATPHHSRKFCFIFSF